MPDRATADRVASVAVGERMGVVGAMSVELATRCLGARDIDGVVIGDGLSPKMVVSLLVVLGEDARFRDLPVAMLGPEERIDEFPNLVCSHDPQALVARMIPLVRQRAFEAQLKRLLKSIESKGMLDPRTGLLGADAFGRDLARVGPMEAGPWVLLRLTPGLAKNFGGVATDIDARVLDEAGAAIPGLYAAGEVAGMILGGGGGDGWAGSVSACFWGGRVAGDRGP